MGRYRIRLDDGTAFKAQTNGVLCTNNRLYLSLAGSKTYIHVTGVIHLEQIEAAPAPTVAHVPPLPLPSQSVYAHLRALLRTSRVR